MCFSTLKFFSLISGLASTEIAELEREGTLVKGIFMGRVYLISPFVLFLYFRELQCIHEVGCMHEIIFNC
jgi:hypothetical protein